jgi:hypothetical protein
MMDDGDRRVVWNSWTDPAREALAEPPQKWFRAGSGGEFGVAYCRLKDENLLVGQERRVISQLQGKNNFTCGLFAFSNEEKDR